MYTDVDVDVDTAGSSALKQPFHNYFPSSVFTATLICCCVALIVTRRLTHQIVP